MARSGNGTTATRAFREIVLRLQGWSCPYCGDRFELYDLSVVQNGPRSPTVDHVFPWSLGGRNAWNRVLVCGACNVAKGDRLPSGCELVVVQWINAGVAEAFGQTSPIKPPALGLCRTARQRRKRKRPAPREGARALRFPA